MEYKSPLVSVVMPAYNAEHYIKYAIESILAQTYSNFELIIVEDKSTDRTLSTISTFKDPRIKLLKNNENKGIAYSTNKGIEISKGKYIALMDDDDIAVQERLAYQVNYLEKHPEIDILGGRSVEIDSLGKQLRIIKSPRFNPRYIKSVLLFNNLDFCNGTAMIRKVFIDKNHLKYQDHCYGMQDYKFYIDSSKLGCISSIDQILLKYRVHDQNETKRRMEQYGKKRAQVYADFQRYSLKRSGFILDEASLQLINKVLAEYGGHCDSLDEFRDLYLVFGEILRQARIMEIDYYDELQHLCKSKLSKQLIKMDIWSDNIMCRLMKI